MAESGNFGGINQSGDNNGVDTEGQNGDPLVFFRESSLFGQRRPTSNEWLKHEELFKSIGTVIDPAHITGLQRVNGLWRIYLDNLDDKVALITQGVPLRGKTMPILRTNPFRADGENTTRVRVKNVPLSADDDQITRVFTLKDIDVITVYREKLRIDGKLTNCATGDRIFTVKSLTLKEPLPTFMEFGQFKGRVIHHGQTYGDKLARNNYVKCSKCLEEGHRFSQCENDWKCRACNKTGHKEAECKQQEIPSDDPDSCDSSGTESDSEAEDPMNDKHSTEVEKHVEPREPVDEVTKTPKRTKDGKKKSKAKKGVQATLEGFVTKGDGSGSTPDQGRRAPVVTRSPPTPAEELNDNSKKTKS